jgi:hypothetical protein
MTQAADITVKKADGTTDIVWTLMQPASGDGSTAVWRSNTVGDSPAVRPQMTVTAKPSKGGVRHVNGTISYPSFVEDADGIQQIQGINYINFHGSIAPGTLDSDSAQLAAQGANLLASTLMKAVMANGFAPT